MGQKVNPNCLRYGVNRNWQSRWVASNHKQTALWLIQDDKIRTLLIKKYAEAQIDSIEIEREKFNILIFIYAAQPGFLLGKDNTTLKKIKLEISKIIGREYTIEIKVMVVENPQLSARIVARSIADAIEKKVSFRNAQKLAIKKVLNAGALGIKTRVSGRLGGVEMAREEGYSEGIIPLSTLRSDIDYALEEASTTYGVIGVKVWINRGEIFGKKLHGPSAIMHSNKNKFAKNLSRKVSNNANDKNQIKGE